MIELTIPEAVVPYVRMTQRSKWVDPSAQAYLSNKGVLRWYMSQEMDAGDHKMYDKTPLAVKIIFYVTKLHSNDLDNLTKAVLDAAQGIFYKNDNYIDIIVVTREYAKEPRVKIRITPLTGEACQENDTLT